MRRPSVLTRIGLTAGLAAATLLAPGAATTQVAVAATCPSGPVTIAKVVRAFEGAGGPACFGGRLLTFRAFVQPPCNECGGASATEMSPLWLDGLLGSSVILSDGPRGGQVPAFVPPALGTCSSIATLATCPFRTYVGRWVTVGAHFDGPVSQTCRYGSHPPGPGFSASAAVEECRQELIVLSVGDAAYGSAGQGSLPDTATIDAAEAHGSGPGSPPAPAWAGLSLLVAAMFVRRCTPGSHRANRTAAEHDSSRRRTVVRSADECLTAR